MGRLFVIIFILPADCLGKQNIYSQDTSKSNNEVTETVAHIDEKRNRLRPMFKIKKKRIDKSSLHQLNPTNDFWHYKVMMAFLAMISSYPGLLLKMNALRKNSTNELNTSTMI